MVSGARLRQILLVAEELGMGNGEYVFLTQDIFANDALGVNGWKRGKHPKLEPVENLAPPPWRSELLFFSMTLSATQRSLTKNRSPTGGAAARRPLKFASDLNKCTHAENNTLPNA